MRSITAPNALGDDPALREALKRCAPSTYEAACQFRSTRDAKHLSAALRGIIGRFVAPALRARLRVPDDDLRLVEDLGIDSLTMIEIVSLAEDVFPVSIDNEELAGLRTVGDIQRFLMDRLRGQSRPEPAPLLIGNQILKEGAR
jgi:3-hydroxyacyl-[acyl-carrier-protein] dehydratase